MQVVVSTASLVERGCLVDQVLRAGFDCFSSADRIDYRVSAGEMVLGCEFGARGGTTEDQRFLRRRHGKYPPRQ